MQDNKKGEQNPYYVSHWKYNKDCFIIEMLKNKVEGKQA